MGGMRERWMTHRWAGRWVGSVVVGWWASRWICQLVCLSACVSVSLPAFRRCVPSRLFLPLACVRAGACGRVSVCVPRVPRACCVGAGAAGGGWGGEHACLCALLLLRAASWCLRVRVPRLLSALLCACVVLCVRVYASTLLLSVHGHLCLADVGLRICVSMMLVTDSAKYLRMLFLVVHVLML